MVDIALGLPSAFFKDDPETPWFTRADLGTIVLNQNIRVVVESLLRKFAAGSPVIMPALTPGTNYAIYVCADGSVRADANFSALQCLLERLIPDHLGREWRVIHG